LSGRIFGFSQWSMLVPQALEGVASVGLLYAAVRRWFGPPAGLIAGLVLALTPVAALMFRFNNPDALLVLLMTAAAYALVRAIENGRTRWLVFCGVLLGFAFLAKMLQAFLVVPGFAIAYLWAGAPRAWLRRPFAARRRRRQHSHRARVAVANQSEGRKGLATGRSQKVVAEARGTILIPQNGCSRNAVAFVEGHG